jgi:hypothetical protein
MTTEAPVAPPTTEAPTLLAGKFTDTPALEKGYLELQAKLGAPKQPPSTDAAQGTLKIEGAAPPPARATTPEAIVAAAGLDPKGIAETFAKDGKLSGDQYAALDKAGYGQPAVDAFLRGQQAEAKLAALSGQQLRTEALAIVGGEAQFGHLAEWARANCTKQELDTFNSLVDGDKATAETVRMAMTWLNDRHGAATGRVAGSGMPTTLGAAPPAVPFRDRVEMAQAMADPRYAPVTPNGSTNPKHDRSYYDSVNARITRR